MSYDTPQSPVQANVSVSLNPPATTQFTAGELVALNNLMNVAVDQHVYPAVYSDYAATADAGTAILVGTNYSGYYSVPKQYGGQSAVQGPDGSIYQLMAASTSANTGLQLLKLSSLGVARAAVIIDNTATSNLSTNIFFLSNGNLCVTWSNANGTTGSGQCAIFNPVTLALVTSTTLTNATQFSENLTTIPLSGGGFAAIFNTSTTQTDIVVYANNGVVGAGPVTLASGSYNVALPTIDQLSNGNILVTYWNGSSYYFAIYSTALAIVQAPLSTTLAAYNATGNWASALVSVLSGYWAFEVQTASTTVSYQVFNNAGTQQGTTQTLTTSGSIGQYGLTNDGTNFWAVTTTYSPNNVNFTKVTTAGASTTYNTALGAGTVPYLLSAAYDQNVGSVIIPGGTAVSQQLWAFNINLLLSVNAGTTAEYLYNGFPIGDGVWWFYGTSGTTEEFGMYKTVDTAVLGPAQNACAAGASCTIDISSGYKQMLALKGSPTKKYDHTASNLYGNKGALVGTVSSQVGM